MEEKNAIRYFKDTKEMKICDNSQQNIFQNANFQDKEN